MNFIIAVVAGLMVAVIFVRLLENRLTYFPPRYPEGFAPPENYGLHAEEVWVTASDGVKLNAWFFPNAEAPKVLLYLHGNAENMGYGLGRMKLLSRLAVNLMALDYRGYGKSEGKPDEAGVCRDAEAAYRYLIESRGFTAKDIIVHGQSLGGAVAIDLASRHECGGLIVESSFTSAREMARRMLLIPFLEYAVRSRFNSLAKISRVGAPVLIIHGTRDDVVPFSMGQKLYQAAREPKRFWAVEGAGHNDLMVVGGESYLDQLRWLAGATPPGMAREAAWATPGTKE